MTVDEATEAIQEFIDRLNEMPQETQDLGQDSKLVLPEEAEENSLNLEGWQQLARQKKSKRVKFVFDERSLTNA